MSAPLLEVRGLHFGYEPDQPVLRGIDLELRPGQLCCVLGPNGSGKTTLLRCLLGQHAADAGEVRLDGRSVRELSAKERALALAYVPQLPSSAFSFTVRELVAMGRFAHQGALGLASNQDAQHVQHALERTGTLRFADRTLGELSGGEAQSVMIARALAQQPRVMLLDEPTSHLDLRNQLLVYGLVRDLTRERGMAALVVGHDVNLAARHADTLILLQNGTIVGDGEPARVLQPDLLRATYGVEVELVDVGEDVPIVRALAPS